ncbi:MAG: hypothetical protein HY744_05965 [Deltaproteobacteria bacterium]|nr:hypothetical protein [Deltaproteobacteria bacterium]
MKPIEALAPLDRRHLHLFVAGPGAGEGLALALPERGWVLVDGCRCERRGRPDRYPLERIVADFGPSDPVLLMIWTHPHQDHVHGVAELIEALRPERVAITGAGKPQRSIADEVDCFDRLRRQGRDGAQALRSANVVTALRAIQTWAETRPGHLLPLCDGTRLLDLETTRLTLDVQAPHPTVLESWSEQGLLARHMVERANWLSAVLEVRFAATTVVLGGDLPVREGGQDVPTGWRRVMEQHPELTYHVGLKIPHHGSRDALHPDLVAPFGRPRAWCLTPFNSAGLPRTDDDDGLDLLLEAESPIMLTALSLSRKLQAAHAEGRVTPREIDLGTRALRSGGTFLDGDTLWRSATALDPLDPVWCVAFDDAGHIVDRWRGRAALEVHR